MTSTLLFEDSSFIDKINIILGAKIEYILSSNKF